MHARPPDVEDRLIPGHWEGALIKGAQNRSAIGTRVARTPVCTVRSRMDHARAEAALSGFSPVLNRIEAHGRLSLPDAQGRELAAHQRRTDATGVKGDVADPPSPWQRGSNETTHGRLRQDLPKGRDVSGFTQEELEASAWRRNTRPRTSLGVRCPAEWFTPDAFDCRPQHAARFARGH